MKRKHLGFSRRLRRNPMDVADLRPVFDLVSKRIAEAAIEASHALAAAGIPHALVGGLAIGAYGHPRATKDVDFLVSDDAFVKRGRIVTLRAEVPIEIGGVPVDSVPIAEGDDFLDDAIASARQTEGVPVLPLPALVFLKLSAGRRRDLEDVAALLREGVDPVPCGQYLERHAPELVEVFTGLCEEASDDE